MKNYGKVVKEVKGRRRKREMHRINSVVKSPLQSLEPGAISWTRNQYIFLTLMKTFCWNE